MAKTWEKEKEKVRKQTAPEVDADGYLSDLYLTEGTEVIYSKKTGGDNTACDIYRIISKISKGGFANTYLVERENDNRVMVLKEFCVAGARRRPDQSLEMNYDEEVLKKFRMEPERLFKLFKTGKGKATCVNDDMSYEQARRMSRMEVGIGGVFEWRGEVHSNYTEAEKEQLNLVKAHTPVFTWCGNDYYAMEFVNGVSLSDFIDYLKLQDKLDLILVLRIMEQMAIAVRNIHDVNCIHQDLSPNNIMIDIDEKEKVKVKIIDFGLATDLDSLRSGKTVMLTAGTPGFTDIETGAYIHYPGNEKLVDIYSMGALLYFMVFFDLSREVDISALKIELNNIHLNPNNWETIRKRVKGKTLNANLLKDCYKLVAAATVFNYRGFQDRIQSADKFLQLVQEIVENDRKKVQRKSSLVKAGGLLMAAFLGQEFLGEYIENGIDEDDCEILGDIMKTGEDLGEDLGENLDGRLANLIDSDAVWANIYKPRIANMLAKMEDEDFDIPELVHQNKKI